MCGGDALTSLRRAAREGVTVAGIALGGAVGMFVASSILLVQIARAGVEAKHDRATAAAAAEAAANAAAVGCYEADPRDCAPLPNDTNAAAGGAGRHHHNEQLPADWLRAAPANATTNSNGGVACGSSTAV